MDSTLLDSIKHIISTEDTLLSKVNTTIQNSTPSSLDKYIPLIAGLGATFLTLCVQYIFKLYDERRGIITEKNLTKAKIINLISLLKFHLNDLAYLEVEVVFLYYQYDVETRTMEKSALLNDYHREYGYKTIRKDKISQGVADIVSGLIHYYECQRKEVPDDLSDAMKKMTNSIMNYKTMEYYKTSETVNLEKVRKDARDLKRLYLSYLGQLETEAELL